MSSIRHLRTAFFVLAGASAFLLVFFLIHLPHGPEHWSADLRTAFLSTRPETQHARIALIEVTHQSLQQYPYVAPIRSPAARRFGEDDRRGSAESDRTRLRIRPADRIIQGRGTAAKHSGCA